MLNRYTRLLIVAVFFCGPVHANLLGWFEAGTTETCTAEDFTSGYTEGDTTGDMTIAASTITLGPYFYVRYNTYYHYTDKTADYYDADFKFRFNINLTNVDNYMYMAMAGVLNVADEDFKAWIDNDRDGIYVRIYHNGNDPTINIHELVAGEINASSQITITVSTDYYIEFSRDEDIGTYGAAYLKVYSDVGYSSLVDSVSISLTEKEDFRYLYAVAGFDGNLNSGDTIEGTINDLCEF